MITTIARGVVVVLGSAICVMSAYGIHSPGRLIHLVESVWRKSYGLHLAVVVRLVLGAALILSAPHGRFPLAFQAVGWAAIAAAVVIPVLGRGWVDRVIVLFERSPSVLVRVWCALGVAFGASILYGVW